MKKESKYYINKFLAHREVTRSLVNKLYPAHYNYQPTATSMTAEELVIHMLDSFHQFVCLAAQSPYQKLYDETEQVNLLELVDRYTDTSLKLLESFDDEMLEAAIDANYLLGKELPAWKLIEEAIEHEINHKGNLFVYMREIGYKQLPMYVKF